jgi:hypothetical protein
LGGLLYNGQIKRVLRECLKESKDIACQSAVQSVASAASSNLRNVLPFTTSTKTAAGGVNKPNHLLGSGI